MAKKVTPKQWCENNGVDYRLYQAWVNMRNRCNNPNAEKRHIYAARGITICGRWDEFAAFAEDMGPHPGVGWSLDRRDNSGGYCKGNCRWVMSATQTQNSRKAKLTASQVVEIRRRAEVGNASLLAAEFRVHRTTISRAVSRRTWQ